MSAVDFQLVDEEKIGNSIIKRDFKKIYHQSGADVNKENSNIKFYFRENHKFIKVGNGNLEFDIKIRKDDNTNFIVANDNTNEVIRLVNNAFFYIIYDARL